MTIALQSDGLFIERPREERVVVLVHQGARESYFATILATKRVHVHSRLHWRRGHSDHHPSQS